MRWVDGRLDFEALQRRYAQRRRATALARAEPCHFVVFDVLETRRHGDLRRVADSRGRRQILEELFRRDPDPASHLSLGMQTADPRAGAALVRRTARRRRRGTDRQARGQPVHRPAGVVEVQGAPHHRRHRRRHHRQPGPSRVPVARPVLLGEPSWPCGRTSPSPTSRTGCSGPGTTPARGWSPAPGSPTPSTPPSGTPSWSRSRPSGSKQPSTRRTRPSASGEWPRSMLAYHCQGLREWLGLPAGEWTDADDHAAERGRELCGTRPPQPRRRPATRVRRQPVGALTTRGGRPKVADVLVDSDGAVKSGTRHTCRPGSDETTPDAHPSRCPTARDPGIAPPKVTEPQATPSR